ncbi:MAG: archaemetzincin [Spirochaetota bacterium]|nr:archaemetzincin [Spirochaetota bacterium]
MPKSLLTIIFIITALSIPASSLDFSQRKAQDPNTLRKIITKLNPLHTKLPETPAPGDWLDSHPEEGQTFDDYLEYEINRASKKRHTIYIQPLGLFTASERKIVKTTAKFMSLYFDLPVKVLKTMPLSLIPKKAQRRHPSWGNKQLLTSYILYKLLKPRVPKDAVAYIAFTGTDLYPEPDWNFVYGQAVLKSRVGVWSLYRNGNPDISAESYKLALLRTLKTGTHEMGHMFSIKHCIAWHCNMNGSNHREESDSKPLYLCPECAAKLSYACGSDLLTRYKNLLSFTRRHGFHNASGYYKKAMRALKN